MARKSKLLNDLPEIGQLLAVGLSGLTLNNDERQFLQDVRPAGVVYFRRNIESPKQLASLSQSVWSCMDVPPLIAIDQEGGWVARLTEPFTEFPGNDFLGRYFKKTKKVDLIVAQARAMCAELRAIGVNYNFVPVADVLTNPANPIIDERRAFSTLPKEVARFVSATVRTYKEEKIISCAKHFPGHGDTALDSHFALPKVSTSRAQLFDRELLPFQRAVGLRVPTMMTAHVIYEALDSKHPATLSKKILQGLLRKKLGFTGVIVSDDLEMKAISDRYPMGSAAIEAVNAGVDLLLVCKSLEWAKEIYENLERAWRDGTLNRKRVKESLVRIKRLKKQYLPGRPFCPSPKDRRNGWARHRALSERIQRMGA